MRKALSVVVLLCSTLLLTQELAAQTRSAPARSAKAGPKIGGIFGFTSAAQLASALVGSGVTISNATFTGNTAAAGTFTGGTADIGIDSGVILSTGRVGDAQGPNQASDWSTDFGLPGDADLNALVAPGLTQDATILEFDVTPVGNTIAVRFVFASEEYNEFVGSEFNDVIAVYVNGINCANYNGLPVSINTINKQISASLFFDNEAGVRNTEFDGLTVPLDCVAAVNPGVPNRVKIAIADNADGIYDAAVFLAAGGVRSPGTGPVTGSVLVKAFEFYHTAFNHYFITAIADEITKLDNGTFAGWSRTGKAFNVFVNGTAGTVLVCRFFSTAFGLLSSHFYTPFASECGTVRQNPSWQFEAEVFAVILPDANGNCPPGTTPLYRLYNNGMGGAPNHRYTTEPDAFNTMVALGWVPEGSGVGVIACVPL